MTSPKGSPEETLMAAIFEVKPWDPRFPLCYPYIVEIGEDGEERILGLAEAIQNALDTLTRDRHKRVIELRFGLNGAMPRTLLQVAQELGIRYPRRVAQIQDRALRVLRYPTRSRRLREFLVLSPEEMARDNKKRQEDQRALRLAEERISRLVAILKVCGLREEDFEGGKPDDILQAAQDLREAREDQEALRALKKKFPHRSFWGAIARAHIKDLSTLLKLVRSGEVRKIRGIGVKGEEFFRQALRATEQEAPS